MHWLLDLPAYLGAPVAMVGTALLGLVPFLVIGRVVQRYEVPETTREFAGRVAIRVGTLHALILALVFAEVQSRHMEIRHVVMLEAENVAHVYRNLEHFDDPRIEDLRALMAGYARAVVEQEWGVMAERRLSSEVALLQDRINDGVMDLAVDSRREQFLQAQMIEDLDAIEHHRQSRLLLGMHRLPALFWYTAFIGFLIVGAMSFVFAPTVPNMVIVCGYGLYTGLVMYVILAFSYPFTGPAAVDPSPFLLLGGGSPP